MARRYVRDSKGRFASTGSSSSSRKAASRSTRVTRKSKRPPKLQKDLVKTIRDQRILAEKTIKAARANNRRMDKDYAFAKKALMADKAAGRVR